MRMSHSLWGFPVGTYQETTAAVVATALASGAITATVTETHRPCIGEAVDGAWSLVPRDTSGA